MTRLFFLATWALLCVVLALNIADRAWWSVVAAAVLLIGFPVLYRIAIEERHDEN